MGQALRARQARLRIELPVEGGYAPVPTRNLLAAWAAYKSKTVTREDFRVLMACHALACSRQGCAEEDPRLFRLTELAGLTGGLAERRLRRSVSRLTKAGLLLWTDRGPIFGPLQTVQDGPGQAGAGEETLRRGFPSKTRPEGILGEISASGIQTSNHPARSGTFPDAPGLCCSTPWFREGEGCPLTAKPVLPVPRRLLRAISRGQLTAAETATALAAVARCLWLDRGSITNAVGTLPAALVAEAFGLDLRSVKRARKSLQALGFMSFLPMPHWHRQRYGARFEVNLAWRGLDLTAAPKPSPAMENSGSARHGMSPQSGVFDPVLPPPRTNQDPFPTGKLNKHQHPTGGGSPAGVCTNKNSSPKGQTTTPTLRDVSVEDLKDPQRTLALHAALVQRGEVRDSEADTLRVFACAARALRKAQNPGGMFLALVRRKELQQHISGLDEQEGRNRYRALIHDEARRQIASWSKAVGQAAEVVKPTERGATGAEEVTQKPHKNSSVERAGEVLKFSRRTRERVASAPTREPVRARELSRDARFLLEVWRVCERENQREAPRDLLKRLKQPWTEERHDGAEAELSSHGIRWDGVGKRVWKSVQVSEGPKPSTFEEAWRVR